MTSDRSSPGSGAPSGLIQWVGAHRRAVRVVALTVDAVLVVLLVVGFLGGVNPWIAALVLLVWAHLTWQFGWWMPKTLDGWTVAQQR